MKFQTETMAGCLPELITLFRSHYEEIALFRDRIELNPDWQRYRNAEAAGLLKILTARDEAGVLVGYHIGMLMPHPHYVKHVMLFTDIFFLVRAEREGLAGVRFLRAILEHAREIGAEHLVMGTKLHKDLGNIFERLGGLETDRMFAFTLV